MKSYVLILYECQQQKVFQISKIRSEIQNQFIRHILFFDKKLQPSRMQDKIDSNKRINVLKDRTFNLLNSYRDENSSTKTHKYSKSQELPLPLPSSFNFPPPLPELLLPATLALSTLSATRKRRPRNIPSCQKQKQLCSFLDESRLLTLIRFNYRVSERLKQLQYGRVFDSLIKNKTRKNDFDFKEKNINCKGSMNVVELWSDRTMLEVLGETQLPKNRYRILKGILRKRDSKIRA